MYCKGHGKDQIKVVKEQKMLRGSVKHVYCSGVLHRCVHCYRVKSGAQSNFYVL
ncbi:hypothetical protein BS17DRAFT_783913 [Gyrodon lividus]|nr:hypothetical protein BS17DRAFT_783913 [Gyrodon lividus]